MEDRKYQGIGISPGVANGPAFVLEASVPVVWMHRIDPEGLESEIGRFQHAVEATKKDLLHFKEEVGRKMGSEHAYIFDAHILMLEDPILVKRVEERISGDHVNAEFALQQVISELIRTFSTFEDPYLRERGVDVLDVGNRVQKKLSLPHGHRERLPDAPSIVLAHEIVPSKLASIDQGLILGLAMDVGGQTTHTGLLARSQNIPAVVGLRDLSVMVHGGESIIVDGSEGLVIVDPKPETLDRYRRRQALFQQRDEELQQTRDLPAVTIDGAEIALSANVEMPGEMESTIKHGAKGIGLYRSEFVFLSSPKLLPTEEEHEQMYKKIAEAAGDLYVNVRTLDLGGEKGLESLGMEEEPNPALGLRAIRYCLRERSLFKTQLRGILRASVYGNLRVMIPMVSSVDELKIVREMLEKCKSELRLEGIPFNEDIELGTMIEVPSAALTAEHLAGESDFIAVGTNDLIQYTLAIDRSNASVAYLYEHFHPAVLRILADVTEKVHSAGKAVSNCGEMAADPFATPLLIGLGFDELSMNAVSIPIIKNVIRTLDAKHCRSVSGKALKMHSPEEVRQYLTKVFENHYPSLFKCELGDPLGDLNNDQSG